MLRPIAIALILVLSVGVMLPFANEAHGVRQTVEVGQRRHHRYRSRAWWRRYRARLRQKRLAAEMAHRNAIARIAAKHFGGELQGLTFRSCRHCRQTLRRRQPAAASDDAAVAVRAPVAITSNGETRRELLILRIRHSRRRPATTAGHDESRGGGDERPNPAFLTSREEKKMLGGVAVAICAGW
jgi:hypothetical protein